MAGVPETSALPRQPGGLYERFFGLAGRPFSLLPDPRFLYASRTHTQALSLLEYGLTEQAGFVVLTGEVGTGKTTLLRHLLERVGDEVEVGLVTNTHRSFGELMKWVMRAFDLDFRDKDPVERHETFVDHLLLRYAEGKRVVLMIDEAQNLGAEALEQLRMLSNVNTGGDHLLQLMLIGQPELRALLQDASLRQFVQRVGIDYHLQPLDREDTARYLGHRLALVGGRASLFTAEACVGIHWFSHGIPRLINTLADLALVHAYADDRREVDLDLVIEAARARARGGLSGLRAPPEGVPPDETRRLILA
jgi:type II secretory pathway predicted ATPase ExeA